MLLQQEILIGDAGGQGYARATACDLHIEPALFGYRLSFNFKIIPFVRNQSKAVTLLGWEVDMYLQEVNRSVLMGRMLPDLREHSHPLSGNDFTIKRHIDIRSDDFIQLADNSHRGDVTFAFHATPVLADAPFEAKVEEGRMKIPHSEWLEYLNRTGMARFDLIAIRTPVASSHLHKPFSEAIGKIREAERQYIRGDWNGAAASCRGAWRIVLSSVPSGTPPIEHLLAPVIGDPRRKEFATAVAKGLHDILNKAVHLEGDLKMNTPPADLRPEDTLLCLHWYAALIGYLSSLSVYGNSSSKSNP
jgi:hypothetical protein